MREALQLFNEKIDLVNYKLKKQYVNYFDGDYNECEQELRIILWKACIAWFKNKVYEREYGEKKTKVFFSFHYYKYVRGYMSQRKKTMDLAKQKHQKYLESLEFTDTGDIMDIYI